MRRSCRTRHKRNSTLNAMKPRLSKKIAAALFAAFVSFTHASGTDLTDAALTLADFSESSIQSATDDGWILNGITTSDGDVFVSGDTQAYITKGDQAWANQSGSRCLWSAIVSVNLDSLLPSESGVLIESARNVGASTSNMYEGIAYNAADNASLLPANQGGAYSGTPITSNLKAFADENGNVTLGISYKGDAGTTIYVWRAKETYGSLKASNSVNGKLPIYLANQAGVQYNSLYLFGDSVTDDEMVSMLNALSDFESKPIYVQLGYTPVVIPSVNVLSAYASKSDCAFLLAADIESNIRMYGANQYWTSETPDAPNSINFSGISKAAINATKLYMEELNSVQFNNCSDSAIYEGTSNGEIVFRHNKEVAFNGNSRSYGGAVYSQGSVTFSKNADVSFTGNSSSTYGGAIYGESGSDITLSGNGSVSFTANYVSTPYSSSGGAIYGGSNSDITLSDNGSVTFSMNHTTTSHISSSAYYSYGGAIYAERSSNITFNGNGSVTFIGNYAVSHYSSNHCHGGAIYGASGSNISIEGNGNVEFRGNYERAGNSYYEYRLRGLYTVGNSLKLSAGDGQSIEFYDGIYSSCSSASYNAKYVDSDGNEHAGAGDILMSGAHTEEDLRALKSNYSTSELADSRTFEIYTDAHLYGGRLRVEDGAVYKGYGLTAEADSNSTIAMKGGEFQMGSYAIALNASTTLALEGVNKLAASSLVMEDDSTLSITVGDVNITSAALTVTGNKVLRQGGDLTLQLSSNGDLQGDSRFRLLTLSDGLVPTSWDITKLTITGNLNATVEDLIWENGTLYYINPMPKLVTATWDPQEGRVWNKTARNWEQDGYHYQFKDGVEVLFGDSGSGIVTLEGELAPESVLVKNGTSHAYTFDGDGALSGAATLTKEGKGVLTVNTANGYTGGTTLEAGKIVVGNDTALGKGDVEIYGGTLDLNGHTIANNVVTEGEATLCGGTINGNITMTDTELEITGDLAVGGQIQANSENLIAIDDDAILSIYKTIINNGDYLEIAGAIEIGNMAGTQTGSSYTEGETEGNGFMATTSSIQVLSNTSGGDVDLSAAEFSYKGKDVQLDTSYRAMVADADYSSYYVNSGSEHLSNALDKAGAAQVELTGVVMKSGTELQVDRDIEADLIQVVSGKATMNIAQGVTLSETNVTRADFTLQGKGTYALAEGSTTLSAALGANWQGAVQISNVADIEDLELGAYGKAGSTVSMNGVSAKLADATGQPFEFALELVGDGLTITSCRSGQTYTFAGGVRGDGNFTYDLSKVAHKQTYEFTGDVSEWTGAYESLVNKTSTLLFYGDATEMGAAIRQTAGTINVEVGDGLNEHTTTFMNEVEATSFTVKENATAAFEGAGRLNVGDAYSIGVNQGYTRTDFRGLEMTEEGIIGTGVTAARIDHAIVDLQAEASVVFDNVVLGATSRLTDDPATVVANNMVIEGQYGVNVEEGAPMTIKSGSIMQRLGQPSELIELDSDASACRLDITNVDNVSITGNCLTIDLSGMYPALQDFSQKYDWLGISLGSGDQVAMLDTNMVVELKLNDRLHPRAYYMSGVGWGGADFVMPVANGENVGIIYINMFDVPEPTTSTLSLLALAAIAARRRRK